MEHAFFKAWLNLKSLHSANGKIILEMFWWHWSQNLESNHSHVFAMTYYTEIKQLLDIGISHVKQSIIPDQTKNQFLLRHMPISKCLNHFYNVITIAYNRKILNPVSILQNSNQEILDIFENKK